MERKQTVNHENRHNDRHDDLGPSVVQDIGVAGITDAIGGREAALESARIRLRPVAMTTLAMVFGMAPMAVGWGAGGEIRESMAMVVIGGLLSSMFFTLVLVPVVYARVASERRPAVSGDN